MYRRLLSCCLVLGAGLVTPLLLLAAPEPGADELKANRARIEQWRKHPEQLARLRGDARAFMALPDERREQIVKLDQDLHEEISSTQARLINVLERYARWIESLPLADRQALAKTADNTARLALIRTLREQERTRRQEWQVATRFWKELEGKQTLPVRPADLDARDREGITEYLWPLLNKEEKQRLLRVEGRWPGYMTTLVEFADRYPLALATHDGPRTLGALPTALQQRFNQRIANPFTTSTYADLLKPFEGRWPDFAAAVAKVNHQYLSSPLPRELWACSYQSLESPMREYVDKTLRPALTDKEMWRLKEATGHWPDYPTAIQELARRHQLATPPWETALSGPRDRWDNYRALKPGQGPR